MESINKIIYEYGEQVDRGEIRKAYRSLMNFIKGLRVYFKEKYPEYNVSGNIYQGYMDMTFFSLSPKFLKNRDLKVAIVFVHERIKFEVWLIGRNSDIQTEYRKLLRKQDSDKYSISTDEKGVSSIIESSLVDIPNFDNPVQLTNQIETGVKDFVKDIEKLLD